ncbi:ribonuclease Z, partial [Apilactobacillus kunkeei]
KIARDNNVRRLYLNHISARYLGAKAKKLENQAQKIFANTRLANDFDRIVIPMKGEKDE